jgi:predicted metal-binding membrane protein
LALPAFADEPDERVGRDGDAGRVQPLDPADFALNFVIWWVMMPGMMLPSAAPMILTFATVNRRKRARGQPFVASAVFASGYLIAWGLFGIAAALADWGLEQAALISPTTQKLSPTLGARDGRLLGRRLCRHLARP